MDEQAINQAIEVLNRINEKDPVALRALIDHRVPCNQALSDDETVQVGVINGGYEVGLLGVINGLFGVDTMHDNWGWIAAYLDEDKKNITHFGWQNWQSLEEG